MNNNPPGSLTVTLTGQTNELSGKAFSGTGNTLTIGRQQGCQIQINHNQVSRQHARLTAAPGQWLIEDLGSSNGTSVNGQRISGKQPIRSGDRIGMGTYEFIFTVGSNDADRTVLASPAQIPAPPPQPPPQQYTPPRQTPVAPPPPPPQQYAPPPQQYAPPPQQYASPPQPAYQAPAPQPRRRSCLRTCLIVSAVLFVLIVLPAVGVGFFFRDQLRTAFNDLLNQGGAVTTESVSGQDSVTVGSQEGGIVTSDSGASVMIPPGAVPTQENGDPGEMTFSMHEQENRNVSLPVGFEAVGAVYQLGPEGFTFNTPVVLTLPIPDGVDPAQVMGLTYYDGNEWRMVPAMVDAEQRVASVSTTHFSPWAVFGFFDDNDLNWRNEHGGVIRVINEHRYDTGIYPPEGGIKPYTVTYGVCIKSYNLDDQAQGWVWPPPSDWSMTVNDYVHPLADDYWQRRSHDWWLPNGSYELIEVWHFSEVNHAPLYSPQFASFWQPIGTVRVDRDNHQEYSYAEGGINFGTVTAGRPPCFGIADTSVGHGDVQITLTWNDSIDLDLHVIDPNGEEINYNVPTSTSGGTLDRDNRCDNMTIGRPENVFWPGGGAPSGTYKVFVNYYGSCESGGSVSYTLRTVVMGQVETYDGTISPDNSPQEVTTFTVP